MMLRTSEFIRIVKEGLAAHADENLPLGPQVAKDLAKLLGILADQCDAMERRLAGDPEISAVAADNIVYLRHWMDDRRRKQSSNTH